MDYATPFFISLVDADGSMWAYGPLHAAAGGTLNCLMGNVTSQSVSCNVAVLSLIFMFTSYFRASDTVKPAVAIGAGLGGLALGLLVGILGAWLFLKGQYTKKLKSARFAAPSRVPSRHGSPLDLSYEHGSEGTNIRRQPTASSLGILGRSVEYQVEPFIMPGENHTGHVYESQSRTSGYAPIPATQPAPSNQVYVVHRDSQHAPITLYHSDGGSRVVELPPSYPPSPPGQRATLSDVSSPSPSRTGETTSEGTRVETIPSEHPLQQQRRPGQIRKSPRGPS